ncbi:MAG: META domain-containing protein [Cyclobacteriaceae bacterium]|nr:META domain-containing protein [Cyclobacteriaceae bacterium]
MKKFSAILVVAALLISCQTKELSLTDVEWTLASLNGDDYSTFSPPVTLTLLSDSKVAGHAGCNRYFGSYTRNEDNLTFGNLGATKMFCDGKMETEDSFLKALGETDGYTVAKNKLTLRKGSTVLMIFTQ